MDEMKKAPVLEARDVTKRFPTERGRGLMACTHVSLSLYSGETLGIVGESGCGKSTLLRTMAGLEKPDSGEILFHGRATGEMSRKELREVRSHIQMVFQDPLESFHPEMRVKEIVCEPLLNYHRIRRREMREKAEELLRAVELPAELAERFPRELSGGQRQRVGIARALALQPEVLLCDEATSALDVLAQKSVVQLLERLQRERNLSLVFVSHDLALVEAISRRVAVMYKGNVLELMDGSDGAFRPTHPYTKAMRDSVFDLQTLLSGHDAD